MHQMYHSVCPKLIRNTGIACTVRNNKRYKWTAIPEEDMYNHNVVVKLGMVVHVVPIQSTEREKKLHGSYGL